jgi:hypothetical protein
VSVGPASGTGGGGGNQNINDPENPYILPSPSYVAPPPEAPPPAPAPEATGHEESYDSVVATQLATDYPDQTYVSDGQIDASEPPPEPAVTAADYFFTGGNPATPSQAPGPGDSPSTLPEASVQNYGVGFEGYEPSGYLAQDYFTPENFQTEVTNALTTALGPPPQLGDATDSASAIGSGWYENQDTYNQQLAWIQAEAEKAMQFGDSVITYGNGTGLTGTAYLEQLQGEIDRVNANFTDYNQRADAYNQQAQTLLPDIVGQVQRHWQDIAPATAYPTTGPGIGGLTAQHQAESQWFTSAETDMQIQRDQQAAHALYDQQMADGQSRASAEWWRDHSHAAMFAAQQQRKMTDVFGGQSPTIENRFPVVDFSTGTHYDQMGNPIAPTIKRDPNAGIEPTILRTAGDIIGGGISAVTAGLDFFGHTPIPLPGGLTGNQTPAQIAPAVVAPFAVPAVAATTTRVPLPGTGVTLPSIRNIIEGPIFTRPARKRHWQEPKSSSRLGRAFRTLPSWVRISCAATGPARKQS